MDAITALKTRRSIRTYRPGPIPRQTLADLVDCARLAPTAMNQQQWEFLIATNPETLAAVGQLIPHARFLPGAAAVIAVLSRDNTYWVEDASAATTNLLLAAHAHGLGACWVAAEKQSYADPVRDLLGAPADHRLLCLVTVGHPAEDPVIEKRPLESVLHWETF